MGCGVWSVGCGVQTLRGVGCDYTETSIASALTLTHPMHHDHTTSNRHDAHNHRLGRSNPASLHLKNVKGARPPLPRCPGPSPIFGFSFIDSRWGWQPRSTVAKSSEVHRQYRPNRPPPDRAAGLRCTPATAQWDCYEQRTYRYTCGTYRAPARPATTASAARARTRQTAAAPALSSHTLG